MDRDTAISLAQKAGILPEWIPIVPALPDFLERFSALCEASGYEKGVAAGDLPMVGDLAMLVARLARKLRKATPADELPAQALDYLNRNGLKGSPLRKVGAGDTAVVTKEMIGAAHGCKGLR